MTISKLITRFVAPIETSQDLMPDVNSKSNGSVRYDTKVSKYETQNQVKLWKTMEKELSLDFRYWKKI